MSPQLCQGISPGRHRLGLQGFLLIGLGHFRRNHPIEIFLQADDIHRRHGTAVYDEGQHPTVRISIQFKGIPHVAAHQHRSFRHNDISLTTSDDISIKIADAGRIAVYHLFHF